MINGNWCRWTNNDTEKNQNIYGTTISILYKMGENVVVILHIYGAIAIFLLFCDDHDTKLE